MSNMLKMLFVVALILLFSCDGIYAVISRYRREKRSSVMNENKLIISTNATMSLANELLVLKNKRPSIKFPDEVMYRGGFTGRGSPLLTRNKYQTIESIDKAIERIVRNA